LDDFNVFLGIPDFNEYYSTRVRRDPVFENIQEIDGVLNAKIVRQPRVHDFHLGRARHEDIGSNIRKCGAHAQGAEETKLLRVMVGKKTAVLNAFDFLVQHIAVLETAANGHVTYFLRGYE